jgi:DNA-binding LacI/PurR family transcriptional regulator
MTKRVTIKQVAAHAGVSYQTVSRVINRMPDVAPETRARVLAAIQDLHYVPRTLAGILSKQSSPVIGVVIPLDTDSPCQDPYQAQILNGISLEVAMHGGIVLLSSSKSTGVLFSSCQRLLDERNLDGLIIDESIGEDEAQLFVDAGFPIIIIGYTKNNYFHSIHSDDECRTYGLTQHLIATNHRRIGAIYSPTRASMQARMLGFERAFQDAGVEWFPDLCVPCEGIYPGDGFSAVAKLMTMAEPPTAICSFSNCLALGTIQWLLEYGPTISGDITIACLDEITNVEFFKMPITTVQLFPFELGRRAATILFDLIQGHEVNKNETVVPSQVLLSHSHNIPPNEWLNSVQKKVRLD